MNLLKKIANSKVLTGILVSMVLCMVMLPAVPVKAEDTETTEEDTTVESKMGSFDFGLKYGADTGLGTQDIRKTISGIINVALSLLGIVAVVIILIGGFEWMTAGGNEDKVGEAKKRIMAGVIGLAIILSAYALAKFILTQLYKGTTGLDYSIENEVTSLE